MDSDSPGDSSVQRENTPSITTRSRARARQVSMDSDSPGDSSVQRENTPSITTRSRARARQVSMDSDSPGDSSVQRVKTPSITTRSRARARQVSMDSDSPGDSSVQRENTPSITTRSRACARQVYMDSDSPGDSTLQTSYHGEYMQQHREEETTPERALRLRLNAERQRRHREQETTPERTLRLQLNAERQRRRRQHLHVEIQMIARQNTSLPGLHYNGAMSLPCISCGALHFYDETHRPDNSFNMCCNFGSVTVPVFEKYPEQWKTYLTSMVGQYTSLRQNLRNFNSALAMASMGAQIDIPDSRKNPGPYCFRIHGQIYHHIGPLHPAEGEPLSYGQIYILDTDMAAEERLKKVANVHCDPALMAEMGVFLSQRNPYAQSYFMMSEIEKKEEETARREGRSADPVRLIFDTSLHVDERRYNLPAANEVAIVFVGQDDDVPPTRSLAVHSRSAGLQIISDIDKLCDPLTYPILYPTGGYGWHPNLIKTSTSARRSRITQKEYYCYLLHTRTGEFNPLHHCNKLFQQYIVDSWVKTEQNRLNYDRQHQSELRLDSYKGLQDYMGEDNQEQGPPGRRIVLPASYKGGPRDMHQSYQDAMAIVAKYGKPEYFLTMTCNPRWKEIIEQLNPGQNASDRPDIVARVFQLKVKKLFDCLLKEHILGEVAAYVAVVEFQKRGLPHIFEKYPEQWKTYLTSMVGQYTSLRQNLRNFNSALAMASMGAQIDIPDSRKNPGPYCFRIHGQIYHHIGPLHPAEGEPLSYGQIYILDTDMAAEERLKKVANVHCDPALMAEMGVFLSQRNPYAQSYFMMSEIEKKEEETARREGRSADPVRLIFDTSLHVDERRYNLPAANEVAIVFVGQDDDVPPTRSLAVHSRSAGLQIISDIDKLCDPLTYPILYPTGGYGWHPNLIKTSTSARRSRITQKEYYCYLLHTRTGEFNPLHHCNKLFQQYIVDSWVKTEQNRLNYDRQHQSELRLDSYKGLQDYMGEDNQEQGPPGRRIVLPASYKGGPRDMHQSYQDAMAIVAKYGKPEYFLTMTCNPRWKEIIEQLNPGQNASDRPDIVARVFQLKVKKLFDCLLKEHILGEVAAYVAVVEFQKRGLPHIHMLIIMKSDYKLRSARDIDSAISAEFPDKDVQPELFDIVASCMIHRPCGAHDPKSPCMKDGVCTKMYPKDLRADTQMDGDSYPKYRRRNDARFIELKGVCVDNKWVVPYNPYLSSLFGCHINLEVCALIQAVKYLYKYVYKGSDRAALKIVRSAEGENVQVFDEISAHLNARYVCAPEAALRLFGFEMQKKSDAIYRLQVHLESQQTVTFQPGKESAALHTADQHHTNLTSFFAMNQLSEDIFDYEAIPAGDMIDSREISYMDMPLHFTFSDHTWKPRKRGERQLGRMFTVSPKDPERFCLRLLLLHRKGSKSFEDLRTVDGTLHTKYIDAAKALGLFKDDRYYALCMEEATTYQHPAQLRSLFACLIAFTEIREPVTLWDRFKKEMSEDYLHSGSSAEDSVALCYYDIMDKLIHCGVTLSQLIDPPARRPSTPAEVIDVEAAKLKGEEKYETLNQYQKEFVDAVLEGADSTDNRLFFLDGPGGSGKTYVYTTLNYILCGRNHRILNVAWTGIAANLLPNGRTVSSAFKLNIDDQSRSSTMKRQSKEAHLLKDITTIIWDEISMTPKHALDAVNSLLQDIMQNKLEFGGKLMILGGDFRQVLPVIEHGQEGDIVDATVKKSHTWIHFHTFHLNQNMRVATGNQDWNSYILHVGDGTQPMDENGCIELPEEIMSTGNLTDDIYGDIIQNFSPSLLAERCILAPKNINVLGINEEVIKKIPGESTTYTSIDEVQADDESTRDAEAMNFPPEFLYSMTPTGMPPHILTLKEGAIVILLKNLDVRNGLCNGSRFIVKQMGQYVLGCEHACGARQGTFVMIPRIDNYYSRTLPFRLCRRQFPIRLAFAMTIHKAQGQSFQKVGVELNDDVFGHGQLYVALSRVRSMDGIKVSAPSNRVKNIVYRDVL